MANSMFTKGKENILNGNVDVLVDNIKAVLVDSASYTPTIATDDALADIAVGARIATSGNMAGKTATNGIFDCNNFTFTGVSGAQSEYVVFYKDSGVEATSYLLCIFDTATGLPVTPNSGDIEFQVHASGLFEI